MPNAKN